MKIAENKTIHLTKEELREAVALYIRNNYGKMYDTELYTRIMDTKHGMYWSEDNEMFIVPVDD